MQPVEKLFSTYYGDWLERWTDLGILTYRAKDIMVDNMGADNCLNLVIRHDIDSMIYGEGLISEMATLEEQFGIRGSYYIIPDERNYRYYESYKGLFLELQARGHEIGLHVNSVEISHHKGWKGRSKEDAFKRLDEDISRMVDDGFAGGGN